MNIIFCCFASQRYWTDRQELRLAFADICKEIGCHNQAFLIDEQFDYSILNDHRQDLILALPMSGGVQPDVLRAAAYFDNVLLYAGYIKGSLSDELSPKMLLRNAAPAVMDIYAVLRRSNPDIKLCTGKTELGKRINAICAYQKLSDLKILAIGQTEPWVISAIRDWTVVKDRFGIEVIDVAQEELTKLYENISTEEVTQAYHSWIGNAESILEPTHPDIANAVRFQEALLRLLCEYRASGAALACFNLLKTGTTSCLGASYINTFTDYVVACEGDMDSAITMLIMKLLSKDSVWMANPNIQPDRMVNFVHCTAPTQIKGHKCNYILRNHHESGIGVSTQVTLPQNTQMTACRISNQLSQITVQNCTGIKGTYEPSCRTQLNIQFEDFDKYVRTALGCHQIFAFEDIKQDLLYFAELAGLEVL